jgi:SHS2 domain-containing protein
MLHPMNEPPRYEELSHTADVALRVFGRTRASLFDNAARGMFHLMTGGMLEHVASEQEQIVALKSLDPESLLVDWLSELLFLFETTGQVICHTEIYTISDEELTARVWHRRAANPPHIEIKAVTYHDLRLERGKNGWEATIVFDV